VGENMTKKTREVSIVLFLSVIVIFVSCGKQEAEWKGKIEVVNGVTIVRNPKQGLWDSKGKANVTIIKERQIGELDGPEEFLFGFISDVTVNRKGDIYVADRKLNEIRKFNKDGKYLLTIGRKGQGPGEFQSATIASVNIHDDLIVFDNMLGRVSIFSDTGDLKETTKKLMAGSWIEPSKIFFSDGEYVFFGKLNNSFKLFHEFGQDWSLKDSSIDYEFIDNKEFEEQNLGFNPGNCLFQDNGDIFYTKYFYDNRIFIYKNQELTKIISRDSDIKKPYEILVFHDVNKALNLQRDKKYQEYDFRSFGQGIAFFGKSFQNSLGLFRLSNGHIANFLSLRKSKDIREYGVELYDSEGKLLTYSKLGENLYYNIRCMDSTELFYAIERKEYNKVIMFRLEY
jgi:hypothetical protein